MTFEGSLHLSRRRQIFLQHGAGEHELLAHGLHPRAAAGVPGAHHHFGLEKGKYVVFKERAQLLELRERQDLHADSLFEGEAHGLVKVRAAEDIAEGLRMVLDVKRTECERSKKRLAEIPPLEY